MNLKAGFLKESAGQSRLGQFRDRNWNNQGIRSIGPIVCEACLKEWPKVDDDADKWYTICIFLDLQIVEECCGALLDKVYMESGDAFTLCKLEETKIDPSAHLLILRVLNRLFPGFKTLLPPKWKTDHRI